MFKIRSSRRKGLDFNKVNQKLNNALFSTRLEHNALGQVSALSILIYDIRLVTLNEIFRELQIRNYEIMKYKKQCHALMNRILASLPEIPHFPQARIQYFRQSSKMLDHDSLIPALKYFLDALVTANVLPEDNPNALLDIRAIQQKGKEVIVGIRIELVQSAIQETDIFEQWGFVQKIVEHDIAEDL